MKIGIVTDGKYGERAFENISKIFDTEWILIKDVPLNVILDDDYKINIPDCDLYISYLRHPDQVFALVEIKKPTILGISFGEGHTQQLQEENARVLMVPSMCSIEPNTGVFEIDTYAHFFGKPQYKIELNEGNVSKVEVLRSSPCGSTKASRNFIKNKPITPENLQDFSLRVCHECRKPRFGRTCNKELAGLIHLTSFVSSLKERGILEEKFIQDFINHVEEEYKLKAEAGISSFLSK